MNPRKKFSQLNSADRAQFLADLTTEMTHPDFNPIKKVILQKVIQYATDQLVNKSNNARSETCDRIFGAKNMAAIPFLEKTIEALNQITEPDSKLRDSVLEDAILRKEALLEKYSNYTSAVSVGIIASSLLIDSWSTSIILLAVGASLFKYNNGVTNVRAAQAFSDQSKRPLFGGADERIDGNFGDEIETVSNKLYGFFNTSKNMAYQVGEQLVKRLGN